MVKDVFQNQSFFMHGNADETKRSQHKRLSLSSDLLLHNVNKERVISSCIDVSDGCVINIKKWILKVQFIVEEV